MEFSHYSVMLKETIEELKVKSDGIYVDGTLGGGGHAYEVCKRLSDAGHFYGIDQDAAAIAAASQRLSEFGDRVTIIRSNYCEMCKELRDRGVTGVDGIVLDLGVSSYQLDEADRGFTYREDAALDMRMDQRQEKTARDIVNGYSETDLYRPARDSRSKPPVNWWRLSRRRSRQRSACRKDIRQSRPFRLFGSN